jgi:hypothetical protein
MEAGEKREEYVLFYSLHTHLFYLKAINDIFFFFFFFKLDSLYIRQVYL